jgi:hypothetical protein
MSYEEWRNNDGLLRKEWKDEDGQLHREDGPSRIYYYSDGSIEWEQFNIAGKLHRKSGPAQIRYSRDGSIELEAFHIAGEYLGRDKGGFWALWEILDEDGRQAPDILKCLARYS